MFDYRGILVKRTNGNEEVTEWRFAARQVGADFLVTGDDKLRRHAPIACLSPQELESLLEAEARR